MRADNRSACRHAPVDGILRPSDEGGLVGGEEQDQIGDIVAFTITTQRNRAGKLLLHFVAVAGIEPFLQRPHHPRVDRRGMHRVDAHIVARGLYRGGAGQADDGMFRGDVGRDIRAALEARDGRHVDHAAGFLPDHHRQDKKVRLDEKGSNCPSYKELIKKYDEYHLKYKNYDYGMKFCNSNIENCCKIDYIYDTLYRLQNSGNNYSEIKHYYDKNRHQYFELNIKGICPNEYNIIKRYNNGYSNPIIALIEFSLLLSIVLCIFGCSNINSNRRYKKPTRR